ncbi:MAG: AAA family ATPase, partial [Candidatus Omnitrophica bacterium]|nr:AAA family ATPase [Candidatus Omnitrophota bacterium]
MRVRKLELFGFKSFAVNTTLHFEPGVTAIVGPNGSGKSNICDAIRWVLGEHNPRDVRAPRLEDVIFNGTDAKAPLSMAEVTLTIDNDAGLMPIAFSEVQITRRVYRSGESECLINQSPCRLKDIQELFLGTGLGGGAYAIIEQGHIDLILSSKPEERRAVFEEASGIARYLAKKQETLRRLDGVEQDLVRVADITQEVRRQLSALERQAAKARQYKQQWEQLKGWEMRLAADELRGGRTAHEELTRQVEALTRTRGELDGQRQRFLGSLESCNAAVGAITGKLQGLRTRVVEATSQIEQHASQLSLKTRWVEELAQQQRQLEAEEAQLDGRLEQARQQRERLDAQRADVDAQAGSLAQQQASVDEELSAIERLLAESAKTLEEGKAELFAAASGASQQRNVLADVALRLQTVGVQLAKADEQRRSGQERSDALAARQQQWEQERRALGEQQDALQRQLSGAAQQAAQANEQRYALMSRLAKARLKGFPESVNALLADPPEGVLGLLVELEAALDPRAFAVVVKDRQALRRCRDVLTAHQLDGVPVVVLSDMAPAEQRGEQQAVEELEALERETAQLQQHLAQQEARWQALAAEEAQLRQQVERLAPGLTKLEGQLTQLAHEMKRVQDELSAARQDREECLRQQRELAGSEEQAKRLVADAEARQQTLEARLKDIQARRDEAGQRRQQHLVSRAQCDASRTALADRRHELDGRIAEAQAQEQDAAAQRRQKQAQREELARKIAELTAQLDEHRAQIPALTESQTAAQTEADRVGAELREAETRRDQVMPGLLAVEQELMRLGQSLKEQEEQLTERTFRRTRILERLREIYRIEESEVLAEQASLPPVSDEEREGLAAQIERLKAKLESIGPVSLGSVEEYDELSKRLEFLQTQQQDLAKAREDLRQTIQQINRTARAQFRETFASIQREFQHYFTRLFNGGQADLILMDEEDVLESGLDIVARPPGKRPQSISLLSGGERALTA